MAPTTEKDNVLFNSSKFNLCTRHPYHNNKTFNSGCGRGTKLCSYCKKIGHNVEVCFKKHGLTPYFKKLNITQANLVTYNSKNNQHEENEGHPLTVEVTPFTTDQHKALSALLQQSSKLTSPNIRHF